MAAQTVERIIEGRKGQPHLVIEVLQDVQASLGYIPENAIVATSKELGVPLIEVFRVANFYKAFSLVPKGRHVVTICMGTACHVRGAKRLADQILAEFAIKPGGTTADGSVTVECVNCLGACALGSVAIVDGAYHHRVTPGKLSKLIRSLKKKPEGKEAARG
jgi:NADH:ubiquinone oxidoreductase subunit E